MGELSKSKLLAYRQCPKRLWLEMHKPDLRADSQAAEAAFETGNKVGEVARRLYDPKGIGARVDVAKEGYTPALNRSIELLKTAAPIFEAGFSADGAVAFADVVLPVSRKGESKWRMVEVKASTSVKDYHKEDAAIQAFVSKEAGVPLAAIAIAHIDNEWVYPGDEKYRGLLIEQDVSDEVFARHDDVKEWIKGARAIVDRKAAPKQSTGDHCFVPFECPFFGHCQSGESQPKHSVDVLPKVAKALRAYIDENDVTELEDVPDRLLNKLQRRVKRHTLSGKVFFDKKGAAQALSKHKLPAYFLDFETVSCAVPIWASTRPYQQIPFQFSTHGLTKAGQLSHVAFLQTDGADPSRDFAAALVDATGSKGPVFVYNAAFERSRITELAKRFRRLRKPLEHLAERLVDLLPIAQNHYYHPSQQGSWSLKSLLPAVAPDLDYSKLTGVKDGGMAMTAFLEAIDTKTDAARKAELEAQLIAYCNLDTFAMVRIWQTFAGRSDIQL